MAFTRNGATAPTAIRTTAAAASAGPFAAKASNQALTPAASMAVTYKSNGEEVTLSFDDIRQYLCPDANDKECRIFLETCRCNGFNPFLKEVYLIKYDKGSPASIVVGKDAFLKRAEAHPMFDGFEAGLVLLTEGGIEYREGSAAYEGEEILGGWAKAYRKDRSRPSFEEVNLNEYIQRKNDGTPNSMWSGKTGTMIRKVALTHAIREAFPSVFAGLYAPEEVGVDVEGSFREVDDALQLEEGARRFNARRAAKPAKAAALEAAPAPGPADTAPAEADDPFAAPGGDAQ